MASSTGDMKDTIVHQSVVIATQARTIAELEKEVARLNRINLDLEYEVGRLENKIEGLNTRIHLLLPTEEVDSEDVLEVQADESDAKKQRTT